MPSATTTKTEKSGTKRKDAPVKDAHVKKIKKAKVESAAKPTLKKEKAKSKPVKKVELSESDDSDDSESDGGVPLIEKATKDLDIEEADDFEEDLPKAEDGLHPDRAKAVVVNSKLPLQLSQMRIDKKKVNRRVKRMRSKSNWQTNEKQQNLWQTRWLVPRNSGNVCGESRMCHLLRENNWLQSSLK